MPQQNLDPKSLKTFDKDAHPNPDNKDYEDSDKENTESTQPRELPNRQKLKTC